MGDTILKTLKVLQAAIDGKGYKSPPGVKEEKRAIAQILALVAIAEELQRANQLKEMELRRLYGKDFERE